MTQPKTINEATQELMKYVEDMIINDKRFRGMSQYIFNIRFFWEHSIPTACAGHGFIFFNPDFWDKLDGEKRKSIISHEIWHLILNHLERGKNHVHEIYNQAADHVINNLLVDEGFVMGPNVDFGGVTPCCDPNFKGMGTEEIYQKIYKKVQKNPKKQPPPSGNPSPSDIEDLVKAVAQADGKSMQHQIDKNQKERDQCTEPGTEAGNSHRVLQVEHAAQNQAKKATYHEIFEDYLTDPLSGGKRTFMRPSRRQMSGSMRVKGKYPKRGHINRLTHLVYALDVSGSISKQQANDFLQSSKEIKKLLNPLKMTIILWDTKIVFEKCFKETDDINNIKISAGGGTQLEPVYKRVKQLNPEALVIFTDLAVRIPPQPSWETIWFIPNSDYAKNKAVGIPYGDIYFIPK